MKQKIFLGIFSVFFFSIFFFSISSAQAAGLFVTGDSIAVQLINGGGLNPDGYYARGSAQVREIAGYTISGPVDSSVASKNPRPVTRFPASPSYDRVVISAGSNCPSCSNNASDLAVIRNKFPNARAVWVVPYNATAAATVRSVAANYPNDRLVVLEVNRFPATEGSGQAPVHPRSSSNVGTAIKEAFAGGGGTSTSGQPQGSSALTETPVTGGATTGLIPCGRKAGQGSASDPCTACHAVVAGKNLMDYLTRIMVVVAVAVIVGMGVLYIMSGVNANLKKTAKAGITAVFVGLVLMLSAWLIVSTILRFLASDTLVQGGDGFMGLRQGEGVYGLQCNTTSYGGTGVLTAGGTITSTPYSGGAGGNGTCTPITTQGNPCSVESLRTTCFSANAETWSKMCNLESRGTPIRSQTDVCTNLGDRSFSGGLFQVNIIANGAMLDREKCNDLGRHTSCVRRNSGGACTGWTCTQGSDYANWDYCMGLTMNQTTNIQAACQLSSQGHVTTPWPHTRRVCNVPTRI